MTGQIAEENSLNETMQSTREAHIITPEEKQIATNQKKQRSSPKQRITVQISLDVIERIKNAVYWTPGLTLTSLAEDAFSKAVCELERERKAPFPKRKEELKTGRPIN